MKEFKFKKIDAFATKYSSGNPAGYILLEKLQDISEQEMLQIAKELKGFVNEVGYVAKIAQNEFELRYYSSEREVDFCGHATIAIMYDIIKTDTSLKDVKSLTIHTNKGALSVENRVLLDDCVFIMSPFPEVKEKVVDVDTLSKKLKIEKEKIDMSYPISIINAGLTTLIVPIRDLNSILAIQPELEELKEFCFFLGVDIIEVFTQDVSDVSNNFRTRVFAPTFGYIEDPATGSGNSAFGYYLMQNEMWKNETITIEQNGLRDNFNIIKLQKQKDKSDETRVCFGGAAITRIEGIYKCYS